jgi:hypothetical protein
MASRALVNSLTGAQQALIREIEHDRPAACPVTMNGQGSRQF